jgi:hypothetical protein
MLVALLHSSSFSVGLRFEVMGFSKIVAVIIAMLSAASAHASSWRNPTFENMARTAELTAIVEVVEGGQQPVRVKVVDLVNGTRPTKPLYVSGYIDEWGSPKPDLKPGERFLVFLYAKPMFPPPPDKADGVHMFAPTPSTGFYAIRDDKVSMRWNTRLWWNPTRSLVSLDVAFPLIRAVASPEKNVDVATRLIDRTLTQRFVDDLANDPNRAERIGEVEALTWGYLHVGGSDRTSELLAMMRIPHPVIQALAARALRRAKPTREIVDALANVVLHPAAAPPADGAQLPRVQAVETLATIRAPSAELVRLLNAVMSEQPSRSFLQGDGGPQEQRWYAWTFTAAAIIGALEYVGLADASVLRDLLRAEHLNTPISKALVAYFASHPDAKTTSRMIELFGYDVDWDDEDAFVDYLLKHGGERGRLAVWTKATHPAEFLPPKRRLEPLRRQIMLTRWVQFAEWGDPRIAEAAELLLRMDTLDFPPMWLVIKSRSPEVVALARERAKKRVSASGWDEEQQTKQVAYYLGCVDVADAYATNASVQRLLALLAVKDFCELLPEALVQTTPNDKRDQLVDALRQRFPTAQPLPTRMEILVALERLGVDTRATMPLDKQDLEVFDFYVSAKLGRVERDTESREPYGYTPRTQR